MRKTMMLVGLLAAVGCGSDSFDPSLPGPTPLNQLSAEQAITLCTEAENFTRSALSPATETEYDCRSAGIEMALLQPGLPTDAETRAACKVGYQLCKGNPRAIPPKEPVAQVCAGAMAELVGCTATVDQFAACLNDSFSWLSRNLPSCDQLTTVKAIEIARGIAPPASCQLVETVCAGLASSQETMSSALRIMKR